MTQTDPAAITVAVLGLGAMGSRMAHNLLAAGHDLVVWNRGPAAAEALAAAGARRAQSPRSAAGEADVVIAMVADDDASRTVWLGADGAAGGLRPGALAVESSTLTAGWVRQLERAVGDAGGAFLEAPVLGSRPQAEAGQLVYLLGGDATAVQRFAPLLDVLGSRSHHLGPVGAAAAAKLAVNAYFATQVAGLAEVLDSLRRADVEQARVTELLRAVPVVSPALVAVLDAITDRSFGPLFPIDLVAKDLRYFLGQERHPEVPSVVARVRQVFDLARSRGFGGDHIAGVAQVFDRID